MKLGVILSRPGGVSPFIRMGSITGRQASKKLQEHLRSAVGQGIPGATRLLARPTMSVSTQQANAVVTMAAVAAADTVTINGTALTATELRANCTVTLATVSAADTVTVNGVVFTAVNGSPNAANGEFDMSGTDAADALTLVTAINASLNPLVYGIIEAVRPAANGAVNIYATAIGTAGNAYTIVTSNGARLAITNDAAGVFAGGAARGANQFDPIGNDTRTAEDFAAAVAASATSLVSGHVAVSVKQAVVTCATALTGDWVQIDGVRLTARTGTHSVTTGLAPGEFSINGTDAQDATSLVAAINEHPTLSQRVFARLSGSTAIIYERAPALGQTIPISSSGSTLAITGSLTALTRSAKAFIESIQPGVAGNATTLATSNGTRLAITFDSSARLGGGTSTTYTY